MSELDLVIQSIKAAKAANLAALHALDAVERLLGSSNTSPEIQNSEPPTEVVSDAIPDDDCQHLDAVQVTTTEGSFLVCGCGVQKNI